MAGQPKSRAFASGVTISIGLIQAQGDLLNIRVENASKATELKMVCPTCTDAQPVAQFYECTHDKSHTDFKQADCSKAKEVGGVMVKLTQAQVDASKKSDLPDKQLDLRVHRTADVAEKLVPGGNSYVFRPTGNLNFYGVLRAHLLEHPEHTLMGLIKLSGNEKLMRLTVGLDNQILLQDMIWPQDVKLFEPVIVEVEDRLSELGATLIEQQVVDFDPANYQSSVRERFKALVEAVAAGQVPDAAPVRKKESTADDLAALLEAQIAQAS